MGLCTILNCVQPGMNANISVIPSKIGKTQGPILQSKDIKGIFAPQAGVKINSSEEILAIRSQ